jgi:glycosyltransferase involved in cell wall biosynthesis
MDICIDQPMISIAMCTFNGERYLAEQLDSILNQSYHNIELVIVDDFSRDGTLAMLREYAARDPRIRIVANDSNIGFVKNFKKAMIECRGELIALADQDDIWFTEKIARLAAAVDDNWLIYSKVAVINARGEVQDSVFPTVNRLEGRCPLSLILNNCVTGHACLIRRELLELALPVISEMPYHDQWLAIAAASRGKLKAGDEVLSYYRKHNNNAVLSNKTRRRGAKHVKFSLQLKARCDFIRSVVASGLLAPGDQQKLEELLGYLLKNDHVIYNFTLMRLLLSSGGVFLDLYSNKRKAAGKLCRGRWFYILLPFV